MDIVRERPKVGDTVMAKYRDGKSYAAEIVKVLPQGYQVEWFDSLTKNKVDEEDVGQIATGRGLTHRFSLGDRIIVEYEASWVAGTVAGLFDLGYFIDWENGGERSRILEPQAAVFPKVSSPVVGAAVLGLSENEWYRAKLRAVFAEGYEIVWDDGSGAVTLTRDQVIQEPVEVAAPTQTAKDISGGQPETVHFQHYLERRLKSGEIVQHAKRPAQYCPHCRSSHEVEWLKDTRYQALFFVCNSGASLGIVLQPVRGEGLVVLEPSQMLTRYPETPHEPTPLLKKLLAQTAVEISPFPPFVTFSVGGKSRG